MSKKAKIIALVKSQKVAQSLSYADIARQLDTTIDYAGNVVREAGLTELINLAPEFGSEWDNGFDDDEDAIEFPPRLEKETKQ